VRAPSIFLAGRNLSGLVAYSPHEAGRRPARSTFKTLRVTTIMTTHFPLLSAACLLTAVLSACGEDELSAEFRSVGAAHDAAAEFNATNPNGVWSYGYGWNGGDFTASPTYSVGGAFAYRGGGASPNGWRGLHKNLTAQPQQREVGLVFPPDALVMHPGNSVSPLTKIRFTAPTTGCYDVDVTWTTLDLQAKRTRPMLYTNAASADGLVPPGTAPGFKELFAQDLVGHNASAAFADMIELAAGEVLSVELSNGGDQYYDDSVRVELVVTEVECPPQLLGRWTFEPGVEAEDLTGHWGPLQLVGNATIAGGELHLHGSGTNASGWARVPDYDGPVIREKTLVSWIALDDLNVRAGAALSLDGVVKPDFDAIVYAERVALRWMAGSDFFKRTLDVVAHNEAAVGATIQVAAAYRDLGGGDVEVTLCRDGAQIGQYVRGNMAEWSAGDAEVLFGKRHTTGGLQPGAIEGRVEEARIYDGAMTCAEVGALAL
jgi:hypothetical protein